MEMERGEKPGMMADAMQPQAEAQAQPQPKSAQGGKQGEVMQRLMLAAMKLVYSDKAATQELVQMVAQAQSPQEGLAHAAMLILQQMREKVQGLNPNAVFAIAPAVIGMLAELAQAAKVAEATPETLNAALEALQAQMGGGQQAPQEQPQEQPAQGIVAGAMQGA